MHSLALKIILHWCDSLLAYMTFSAFVRASYDYETISAVYRYNWVLIATIEKQRHINCISVRSLAFNKKHV